jgi:hypothetical protein
MSGPPFGVGSEGTKKNLHPPYHPLGFETTGTCPANPAPPISPEGPRRPFPLIPRGINGKAPDKKSSPPD